MTPKSCKTQNGIAISTHDHNTVQQAALKKPNTYAAFPLVCSTAAKTSSTTSPSTHQLSNLLSPPPSAAESLDQALAAADAAPQPLAAAYRSPLPSWTGDAQSRWRSRPRRQGRPWQRRGGRGRRSGKRRRPWHPTRWRHRWRHRCRCWWCCPRRLGWWPQYWCRGLGGC